MCNNYKLFVTSESEIKTAAVNTVFTNSINTFKNAEANTPDQPIENQTLICGAVRIIACLRKFEEAQTANSILSIESGGFFDQNRITLYDRGTYILFNLSKNKPELQTLLNKLNQNNSGKFKHDIPNFVPHDDKPALDYFLTLYEENKVFVSSMPIKVHMGKETPFPAQQVQQFFNSSLEQQQNKTIAMYMKDDGLINDDKNPHKFFGLDRKDVMIRDLTKFQAALIKHDLYEN